MNLRRRCQRDYLKFHNGACTPGLRKQRATLSTKKLCAVKILEAGHGGDCEEEQSEPAPVDVMEDVPVNYSFVEAGSIRGKKKLFDSLGYSYIFKKENKDGTAIWRCSVRSKDIPYCPATVKQVGDCFSQSQKCHLHDAICGSESVAKIRQELKASALNNPSEKPSQLVHQVLTNNLPDGDPRNCPSLSNMEQLLRTTRAVRRKNQPQEPKNLDFTLQEQSELEPVDVVENVPVNYSFVEAGSIRGKKKLFDSMGYSYIFKKENKDGTVIWRCPVRSKDIPYCPATVKQAGDSFSRSQKCHLHDAICGSESVARIRQELKASALNNPREKPSQLVREVLTNNLPDGDPRNCPSLSNMEQLLRTTRAVRRKNQPQEPKNLDFTLQMEYVPDCFLVADVAIGEEARHLVFATADQLQLLSEAKCWYADATFKVCPVPFVQLFSLHAFIQKDDNTKQVPLTFVLMSRRRRKDYRKVFRAIREALPAAPKVKEIIMDFETAMWRGAQSVFWGVTVRGCNFYWRQAVWSKVQTLGLHTVYTEDSWTQAFIHKLMALPMLPEGQIRAKFEVIAGEAGTDSLHELCNYVRRTWMADELWTPQSWSVFKRAIRTNNDVEGWHHALINEAGSNSPLYLLLMVLHEVVTSIGMQVLLVSEGELRQIREHQYQTLEARLSRYWDEFEDGSRSTSRLLRACARILGNLDTEDITIGVP